MDLSPGHIVKPGMETSCWSSMLRNWIEYDYLLFISRLKNSSNSPFMDVSRHVHIPMDAFKTFDESETSKNDDTQHPDC